MTSQFIDEHTRKRIKRWYKSRRWQALRASQLKDHPFCQCPHHLGQRVRADHPNFGGVAIVDHKKAHKGDAKLFWSRRNLQSMTKQCHDRHKQSEESGGVGFLKGAGVDGLPLDKAHPFYGGSTAA